MAPPLNPALNITVFYKQFIIENIISSKTNYVYILFLFRKIEILLKYFTGIFLKKVNSIIISKNVYANVLWYNVKKRSKI